jgi:hypothetical protein
MRAGRQTSRALGIVPSEDYLDALRKVFGADVSRLRLPTRRWSRAGKIFGATHVLRRLWHQGGIEEAVLRGAFYEPRLAENAFRAVACAVLEPESLSQAHRWIWGVAWPGGARTTSREVRASLRLLGKRKQFLEDNLFLVGRDLFSRELQHAVLVPTEKVIVLFREAARPVAFEWVCGNAAQAAETLMRRFAPRDSSLLQDPDLVGGIREVFGEVDADGGAYEKGKAVAAFLALLLLAELRRRLPEHLGTSEVLRTLLDLRALEVALGDRRYLVRQRLSGAARDAFRALGFGVPRRVIAVP